LIRTGGEIHRNRGDQLLGLVIIAGRFRLVPLVMNAMRIKLCRGHCGFAKG